MPSRRLIIHILHALAAAGWELVFAADLTKKNYDKDTLFFKAAAPVQRYFFSISFNESDKIRLIDSPNQQLSDAFVQAVTTVSILHVVMCRERELMNRDGRWGFNSKKRKRPTVSSSSCVGILGGPRMARKCVDRGTWR